MGREYHGSAVTDAPLTPSQRLRGYAAHCYTASGVVFAFLSAVELMHPGRDTDPRRVFVWLIAAAVVDATDGPIARAWRVRLWARAVDGRKIDDLLDYLTFVFLPLMLVWRMAWLPEGLGWTVVLAMAASLLGFAHRLAKDEQAGFFRGFPSYWNIYAFYAGLFSTAWSPWVSGLTLWGLTLLAVSPIRMIYPNLAPRPWRVPVLLATAGWLVLLCAMLPTYPDAGAWLVSVSLGYPAAYVALSGYLSRRPILTSR